MAGFVSTDKVGTNPALFFLGGWPKPHERLLNDQGHPKARKAGGIMWPMASQPWVRAPRKIFAKPRRRDIGIAIHHGLMSPLRGSKGYFCCMCSPGWLAMGYRMSPLRGLR